MQGKSGPKCGMKFMLCLSRSSESTCPSCKVYDANSARSGFTSNKNNSKDMAGNVIALHLLVDGLQLQPCNPTVVAARDGTSKYHYFTALSALMFGRIFLSSHPGGRQPL